MVKARPICRRLEKQLAWRALLLARASVGKSSEARMAMMAMTTSSSMSVNADARFFLFCFTGMFTRRIAVGDAVNNTILVIRNKQRAILRHGDASNTGKLCLAIFNKEASQKVFDLHRLIVLKVHASDAVA